MNYIIYFFSEYMTVFVEMSVFFWFFARQAEASVSYPVFPQKGGREYPCLPDNNWFLNKAYAMYAAAAVP